MRKILKKDEYVYMDCKINMSTNKMADLFYAVVMTQASVPTTWGCGIYEYNRTQNSRNGVDVKIHIHPTMIGEFEQLASVKLSKPQSVTIN
jgi:hypothetical protein